MGPQRSGGLHYSHCSKIANLLFSSLVQPRAPQLPFQTFASFFFSLRRQSLSHSTHFRVTVGRTAHPTFPHQTPTALPDGGSSSCQRADLSERMKSCSSPKDPRSNNREQDGTSPLPRQVRRSGGCGAPRRHSGTLRDQRAPLSSGPSAARRRPRRRRRKAGAQANSKRAERWGQTAPSSGSGSRRF